MPVLFGPVSGSDGVNQAGIVGYPGLPIDYDWIKNVADTPDNDLRAHTIALTYLRVANHLDSMIHRLDALDRQHLDRRPTDYNANWFHFATWATLTVTQNIGNERAPQRLNRGIAAPVRRSLTPAILRARASQGQQVGRALAWGQRLIFIAACLTYLEFSNRHHEGKAPPLDLNQTKPAESGLLAEIIRLTTWESETFFDKARHFDKIWRAFQLYELARLRRQPAPHRRRAGPRRRARPGRRQPHPATADRQDELARRQGRRTAARRAATALVRRSAVTKRRHAAGDRHGLVTADDGPGAGDGLADRDTPGRP